MINKNFYLELKSGFRSVKIQNYDYFFTISTIFFAIPEILLSEALYVDLFSNDPDPPDNLMNPNPWFTA